MKDQTNDSMRVNKIRIDQIDLQMDMALWEIRTHGQNIREANEKKFKFWDARAEYERQAGSLYGYIPDNYQSTHIVYWHISQLNKMLEMMHEIKRNLKPDPTYKNYGTETQRVYQET